ncbi:unnamed protein product [Durusdinium trenchii]|uniref:EGF-like domain-containing protein n=1 Tax=Durusdinium trenchii TaxID=1381693 RepID=A0ABP0REU0_9DINO
MVCFAAMAFCLPFIILLTVLFAAAVAWKAWNPLGLPSLPKKIAPFDTSWFILYRWDLDLCVEFSKQITLTSCIWPDLWRFVNGSLEHQHTGLCLTYIPKDWCDKISSNSDLQECVVLKMTDCPSDHHSRRYPDWSQRWHADQGRIYLQALLSETGVNVASSVHKQQRPYMWIAGEGEAALPVLEKPPYPTWNLMLALLGSHPFGDYRLFEQQDCSAGDGFCFSNGQFHSGNCSCACDAPFVGRMCSVIDEDAAKEMSCARRKALGPARECSNLALGEKVQDALNTFGMFMSVVCSSMLQSVWALLVLLAAAGATLMTGYELDKYLFMEVDVSISFGISCAICSVCFVLLLGWNLLDVFFHWTLFPYYAIFRAGRWPYADRAILFCAGDMEFGSYVFFVQVAKTTYSLKGLFTALVEPPDLQEPVSTWIPMITTADAILLAELPNLYTLMGLARSQLDGPATSVMTPFTGFLVCVGLILLELAEVRALFKTRRDSRRFANMEFMFAFVQDLPEFLFSSFVSVLGVWNQYVLYALVSSTIALLTTLARLRHYGVSASPATAEEFCSLLSEIQPSNNLCDCEGGNEALDECPKDEPAEAAGDVPERSHVLKCTSREISREVSPAYGPL